MRKTSSKLTALSRQPDKKTVAQTFTLK